MLGDGLLSFLKGEDGLFGEVDVDFLLSG